MNQLLIPFAPGEIFPAFDCESRGDSVDYLLNHPHFAQALMKQKEGVA